MKPILQRLSAAGASPWIPVSSRGDVFGISFGCSVSSGGTLTYSVQHTFDNPELTETVSIARTTTTATITFTTPHGLSVGDSVVITGIRESNLSGTFAVASVPSTTTATYTVSDTGSAAESAQCSKLRVFEHDTVTGIVDASIDAGYELPPRCVRVNVSAYTDGVLDTNWMFLD